MTETQPAEKRISRRDFLRLLAAGGATAAAGHLAGTYTPWINIDRRAELARNTLFDMEESMAAAQLETIHAATLAANSHNSQPWTFIINEDAIEIHPDFSRGLPVVDPEDRSLWISLGCALENMVITAQAAGYESEIALPSGSADAISVTLKPANSEGPYHLYNAISIRQCTRSAYDGRPVPGETLDQIAAMPGENGIDMAIITDGTQREQITELIMEGDRFQYGDQAFIDELVAWLRFNKAEAARTADGLFTRCTGNPQVPRWLGKMFVTTGSAGQQAETDAANVRSSAGLIVITSAEDNRQAWIDAGRVTQRLALTLTTLGIKMAFINQPIEVAELRPELQRVLDSDMLPQLLIRFGYAEPMPYSLRRPVETVLV
ncbi:MAG: nitroreductase family protein [Anaerolineae bacterium]|nr:nitroreductase family protein [Anaerolineae bacterium]